MEGLPYFTLFVLSSSQACCLATPQEVKGCLDPEKFRPCIFILFYHVNSCRIDVFALQ